jgi:hypothetical protein
LCQKLLGDSRLYELLFRIDGDAAAEAQASGCPECGGRLDSARYPRKPRGAMSKLSAGYDWRFSFCCAVEGCRRRHTPPSIRFLGRRVYLGAVVILATAMQQGVTPVRAQRLHELLGVSLRTLARWRDWWRTVFAESAFWKEMRARFAPPPDASGFPLKLLERFGSEENGRLLALLRFVRPLSTPAGYLPDQRF